MDIKREDYLKGNKEALSRVREGFNDKKVPKDILAKTAEFTPEGKPVGEASQGGSGYNAGVLGDCLALSKYVDGKHIDVDALLAFLEKYVGEDLQTITDCQIGYAGEDVSKVLIALSIDGSNEYVQVLGINVVNNLQSVTIYEALTNEKEAIESVAIDTSSFSEHFFFIASNVSYSGDQPTYLIVPQEEILSIFVEA